RRGLRRRPGVEAPALGGAAERDALDARRRRLLAGRHALVEEDVDGAAASGERLGRDDRREHRVLVVLAHRDHPHVDAVFAHQRREKRVEPLLQPLLLQSGLIAERSERAVGRRQCPWRKPILRRGERRKPQEKEHERLSRHATNCRRIARGRGLKLTIWFTKTTRCGESALLSPIVALI